MRIYCDIEKTPAACGKSGGLSCARAFDYTECENPVLPAPAFFRADLAKSGIFAAFPGRRGVSGLARARFFYADCLCGISTLPSGNGARRPAGRGEIFARQVAFPKARRARCKNARKKNCGNACEKRLRNLPARANANVNAVAHFCSRIRARSECLRGSLLSYVGEYELLRESGV